MNTDQTESLKRERPGEVFTGAVIGAGRCFERRPRRRRLLRAVRLADKGAAPPGDRAVALAQGDGPDEREFLQRAIVELGPRVMQGRPMLALFTFVKGLSEILADRWPPLRHEQACELVKQILRQGGMGLSLLAASECHPMIGWVLNSQEQPTLNERFLG